MFEHDAYKEANAIYNKLRKSDGLKNSGVRKVYQNNVQYWRRRLPESQNSGRDKSGGADKKAGKKQTARRAVAETPTGKNTMTIQFLLTR